jgi:hypothetical protein
MDQKWQRINFYLPSDITCLDDDRHPCVYYGILVSGCYGGHSPLDAVVPVQMFDNAVRREPAVDPPRTSPAPLSSSGLFPSERDTE